MPQSIASMCSLLRTAVLTIPNYMDDKPDYRKTAVPYESFLIVRLMEQLQKMGAGTRLYVAQAKV